MTRFTLNPQSKFQPSPPNLQHWNGQNNQSIESSYTLAHHVDNNPGSATDTHQPQSDPFPSLSINLSTLLCSAVEISPVEGYTV